MEFQGKERIAASRDAVWDALNDPDILKACIPGCQSMERISPTTFTATIKVNLTLFSAAFTGDITLSNVDAPHSYTITAEGRGGLAGFAKGHADVTLRADGEDATLLLYDARAQLG